MGKLPTRDMMREAYGHISGPHGEIHHRNLPSACFGGGGGKASLRPPRQRHRYWGWPLLQAHYSVSFVIKLFTQKKRSHFPKDFNHFIKCS